MINSDDEDRSRSPVRTEREEAANNDLSPDSEKLVKIVRMVVQQELVSVKRNLTKNLDTTTQVKSTVEQVKRGLAEVKMSQANIDDHLKKAKKSDPKSTLSSYVVTKINITVFDLMKRGKKKDELVKSVFDEMLDRGVVGAVDEDSVKAVAKTEFSHLKSHLRGLVSQDLAVGNSLDFPKSLGYLRTHFKELSLPDDTKEFLIIMGLALVKFENLKPVDLSDSDKQNKKKIDTHVDYYWMWTQMKFEKFQDRGESHGEKLKSVLLSCGYQAKKGEGAVRRPVQP